MQEYSPEKNIHMVGVPEEEWEKMAEGLFEQIIAENFPNLGRKQAFKSKRHRELPSISKKKKKKKKSQHYNTSQ